MIIEAMLVRERIDVGELGIDTIFPRRGTDAFVIEVGSPDSTSKADVLASKMREVLKDTGVRVAHPVKRDELRISNLDPFVTKEEVVAAVAAKGGYSEEKVKAGEIRTSPSHLGSIWIQCTDPPTKRKLFC